MHLDRYSLGDYHAGAPLWRSALWFFFGAPLVRAHLIPVSAFKVWLLRVFGAQVGVGVRVKPGVRVKFPWRLDVGDYSWLGEDVWIDNLAPVQIGSHCCISQGSYFCTGDHDWSSETFDLRTRTIVVADQCWIAAKCSLAPGTAVGEGAVLAMGSVAQGELEAWSVYRGNPAVIVRKRRSRHSGAAPKAGCTYEGSADQPSVSS